MANASTPQSESRNVMTVDYGNNNALKTIFARKEAGDPCKLTVELRVMNKTPDQCTLSIEKIITEDYGGEEDGEIEPSGKEPVMMAMQRRKTNGESKGSRSSPMPMSTAQPTENSLGTTSYA